MKWQAIANVTGQINEEAKNYLALKLQKDAAAELPHLWSDFITDTGQSLHESQSHLQVDSDGKNGGLGVRLKFDELHSDFNRNNQSLLKYSLNKYDERTKEYLSRAKNPYSRKLLQEKIGNYRIGLADKINNIEISLIDGKRQSMFVDAQEKLAKASYKNPELYAEHLNQLAISLDALPLMPDKKDEMLKNSSEKLAIAASMGIIKQSPREFLNGQGTESLKQALPLNMRIKLEGRAENILQHQRAMLQNQIKALAGSHFSAILKTGSGIDGFKQLAATSLDEAAYKQLEQREQLYKQAHIVSEQLKHAPFADGAAILKKIKPDIEKFKSTALGNGNLESAALKNNNFLAKEQLYNILEKQFRQQLKAAKDDPAKFVEGLFVDDIPQELPLAQRLLLRKQLQRQKGIPADIQQYLTADEQDEYLRTIQSDDANVIKSRLDAIMAIGTEGNSNGSYQIGLELLAEITKGLDPASRKLSIPVHFYAENHLYAGNNRTRRDLANMFAQIIPQWERLFSSAGDAEKKELEEAISKNKIFREWQHEVTFQQPYNLENALTMKEGIRELSRFYQTSHKMGLGQAVTKATKQMIEGCYMQPVTGLYIPREIISDGAIHNLEEEYIAGSLNYLQSAILKGAISYDAQSSFGHDYNQEPAAEKIQQALKEGRWFLTPDQKQVYYAYQMRDGGYQALMINANEKLTFNLLDLNEPETQAMKQARQEEEMQELVNLSKNLRYGIR